MTLILVESKDSDYRITEVRSKSDLVDFTGNDGSCSFDFKPRMHCYDSMNQGMIYDHTLAHNHIL